MTVTATLFLIVAIAHLLRIILGWHVEIGGLSPLWVSWLAVFVAGSLAYFGFKRHTEPNKIGHLSANLWLSKLSNASFRL